MRCWISSRRIINCSTLYTACSGYFCKTVKNANKYLTVEMCSWHKMTLVRFCKKLRFLVRFRFYKINRSFIFFGSVGPTFVSRRWRHLSFTPLQYDARNDVLPCWICPTNCQLKWLRTRSAVIWHEEKYSDCWSCHVGRWLVNETMWKTVPKMPKSVQKTDIRHFHPVPHTTT